MSEQTGNALAKVPALTFGFWLIKVLATTLGETAGNTLSMSFSFGYLLSTAVFGGVLSALAALQIRARAFSPPLYWATIIASTTAGTTLADFATRSLGIGYAGGSALLAVGVSLALLGWQLALGSVAVDSVRAPRAETFYWVTITLSQTLGTALGDWTADSGGLGYLGGASLFALALGVVTLLYACTRVSRVWLFWSAFVLTRPLGATVGGFLDKPHADGGLDLSRPWASAVLLAAIVALTLALPQRPAGRP